MFYKSFEDIVSSYLVVAILKDEDLEKLTFEPLITFKKNTWDEDLVFKETFGTLF